MVEQKRTNTPRKKINKSSAVNFFIKIKNTRFIAIEVIKLCLKLKLEVKVYKFKKIINKSTTS
ncbi:hypothetical protein ACQP3J_27980 [Escherichia coli]